MPSSSGLALVLRRFSTVESRFRLNHLNKENLPPPPPPLPLPPPPRVREVVSPSTAPRATTTSVATTTPDVPALRSPFGTPLRDALVSLLHAACCTILTHSLTYPEAPRPASAAAALHSSLFRFTRNAVLSSLQFQLYANAKNLLDGAIGESRDDGHVRQIDTPRSTLPYPFLTYSLELRALVLNWQLLIHPRRKSSTLDFTNGRRCQLHRGDVFGRRHTCTYAECIGGFCGRTARSRCRTGDKDTHVGKLLIDRVGLLS